MISSNSSMKFNGSVGLLFVAVFTMALSSFEKAPDKNGTLRITFINTANGKPVVLRDSINSNAFGEQYSISKLKYYISNILIPGSEQLPENDPYHLLNAAEANNNFELSLKAGNYKTIQFLLGVDSIRNCTGAQTGGLDPMNDMFWTWNSGYVMFKLEGTSSSSTADLQRIEHHIGGYKGDNNVATLIHLNFPATQLLQIEEGGTTLLTIETNLDNYWKSTAEIKISETPLCMSTGELAKKMASNFPGLFSVKSIQRLP